MSSRRTRATADPEIARIRAALLAGVPDDPASALGRAGAKALLADLLEWHRREDKPGWWRYFYLRTLSSRRAGRRAGRARRADRRRRGRRGEAVRRAALLVPAAGAPVRGGRHRRRPRHREGLDGVTRRRRARRDRPEDRQGLRRAAARCPGPSGPIRHQAAARSGCATSVSGSLGRRRRDAAATRPPRCCCGSPGRGGGTPGAAAPAGRDGTAAAAAGSALALARLLPAHPGPARDRARPTPAPSRSSHLIARPRRSASPGRRTRSSAT